MRAKKDKYTVNEVSKILGISSQGIYKRLDNSLSKYVKVYKGKKYLDSSVFAEVYDFDIDSYISEDKKADSRNVDKQAENASNDKTIELLSATLETLKQQLEQKDKQIDDLTKSLQFEQANNKTLSDRLLVLEDKQKEQEEQEIQEIQEESIEQETKKSWFKRLFF